MLACQAIAVSEALTQAPAAGSRMTVYFPGSMACAFLDCSALSIATAEAFDLMFHPEHQAGQRRRAKHGGVIRRAWPESGERFGELKLGDAGHQRPGVPQ